VLDERECRTAMAAAHSSLATACHKTYPGPKHNAPIYSQQRHRNVVAAFRLSVPSALECHLHRFARLQGCKLGWLGAMMRCCMPAAGSRDAWQAWLLWLFRSSLSCGDVT